MEFLKKLFSKQKKITIKAIGINDYLEENMPKYLGPEYKAIEDSVTQLRKEKKDIIKKLDTLQKAELVNPDITEHEKQVMLGNKENYHNKTVLFVNSIEIPENYLKLDEFCNEFEEILNEYNEKTIRAYHILRSFFREEMQDISSSLKQIENLHLGLFQTMKKERITALKTILIRAKELNENIDQERKLKKEIEDLEKELNSENEKQNHYNLKLDKLKQSPDFTKLKKYEGRKKAIEEEVEKLQADFVKKLRPFEKPLKKYVHSTKKHTDYLHDPLLALEKDYQFSIYNTIKKIKDDIDKYNLKDKKKNKVADSEINLDYLKNIRKEYANLIKEKLDIQENEKKIAVMMDFKEIEYQLEHNQNKIKKLKETLSDKKTLVNHLNIEEKIKKLEERLSSFTGDEVSIKL